MITGASGNCLTKIDQLKIRIANNVLLMNMESHYLLACLSPDCRLESSAKGSRWFSEIGVHQIHWKGTNARGAELPSGIYLIRLITPSTTQVQRISILR
jgi:hypothetical protein